MKSYVYNIIFPTQILANQHDFLTDNSLVPS